MKNSNLFPKSALWQYGQDFGTRLFEQSTVLLGGIGSYRFFSGRSPRSKCADFKTDNRQDRSVIKATVIGEHNGLRIVVLYVTIHITAKLVFQIGNSGRHKFVFQKSFGFRAGFLVKNILLCVAAFFPRLVLFITENTPVENQINVFGKAFNESIGF